MKKESLLNDLGSSCMHKKEILISKGVEII